MKEADEIYVLDTGSDDNSVEKLKDKGINVTVSKILVRIKQLKTAIGSVTPCICDNLPYRHCVRSQFTKGIYFSHVILLA